MYEIFFDRVFQQHRGRILPGLKKEVRLMGKKTLFRNEKDIPGPFTGANFSRKHAKSQVNGETMETLHNIILRREMRKNS